MKFIGYEFQFLQKILAIKDKTESQRPMLYHICCTVLEIYPDSTKLAELNILDECAKVNNNILEGF